MLFFLCSCWFLCDSRLPYFFFYSFWKTCWFLCNSGFLFFYSCNSCWFLCGSRLLHFFCCSSCWFLCNNRLFCFDYNSRFLCSSRGWWISFSYWDLYYLISCLSVQFTTLTAHVLIVLTLFCYRRYPC